ncbi:MAG: thymidylate kinase [Candidatus Moraniibacteriota bacterium]|nr:MAG: thymidylate kinase [Candidatus Moranbacteria bacterium]
MKKGKLIVIDGSDGSGKATQTRLLIARLSKEGYTVKTLDFPQYEANFFGKLIGECLTGEYGDFIAIDPHLGSVLYAADRFESKPKIEGWLKKGYVVVLDRYVSSNQIHQGGKIMNPKRQNEFLTWLDQMEHGIFGLPRPDLIVYLDVPTAISQSLLRAEDQKQKKVYMKRRKTDLAETNVIHQAASRANALKLVKKLNHWTKIDCVRQGVLLSREQIAEKVWQGVVKIV